MDELTEADVWKIEQIHSNWIEFEVAGEDDSLLALCADDIEFWPPNAQPLLGRTAVSAQMAHGTTRIHSIEVTDRRIRGSNEIAYLTASYKTMFSSAEDSTPRQGLGSHLWILRKRAGTWVVTRELVIMGPCRRFRDCLAASVRQRWSHIQKNAVSLATMNCA